MKQLILSALLLSGACQAQQAGQWIDLQQQDAAALFGEKCGMCHRANGMGTTILSRRQQGELAILENRKDLTAELIEAVVRGGLGVMYPISRGEVSDEQLDRIKQHLVNKQ